MARWVRLFAAALLGLAALSPAEARRQPTVEPAAIVNGALACRGLPDDYAAAERRIVELGWPRSRGRTDNGAPQPMFERDGLILALIPPDDQGHPMGCVIMAAVRHSLREADLAAALSAALGRGPGPDTAAGAPVWVLDGGQVMGMAIGDDTVLLNFWYPRNIP